MEEFLTKAPTFYFKDPEIEYYSSLLKKREYELSISDSKGRKLSGIVKKL